MSFFNNYFNRNNGLNNLTGNFDNNLFENNNSFNNDGFNNFGGNTNLGNTNGNGANNNFTSFPNSFLDDIFDNDNTEVLLFLVVFLLLFTSFGRNNRV